MRYRPLGKTGLNVSSLGLGASPFGGVFGDVNEKECKTCVDLALDAGINLIDTSPFYGLTRSETMLGRCLKGVPRDRYFLATKVGRYGHDPKDFDFSAARVRRSVDESLKRLGVDYVDLIQCHDIEFGSLEQVIGETIPALRELGRAGKVRHVGITGLPLKVLREVTARAEVDTILSYCHYALNDTALEGLLPMLEERKVGIISASPLSMGLLTEAGPPAWHPASAQLKEACRQAAEFCRSRGVNLAQVALQFALANDRIHTTLVGTAKPEHLAEHIRWIREPLHPALLEEVREVLAPVRDVTWPSGRSENN